MHISEEVLKPEILIGGAVISLAFSAYAMKKLKNEEIPLVAVFSALFFIGSFIHIPLGPTSVHLVLNGIVGAILGIRAFISIGIALLLQGLLFGYGGISTLGINTLNMAFPSLLAYGIFTLNIKNIWLQKVQYFSVSFISVGLSALMLSFTLFLNTEALDLAARVVFISSLPIMIIEGFITLFATLFLRKVYPRIFRKIQ